MAFVAGEDSAFFEHSGIDYPSIIRAAWVNLRAGGVEQGASTITQQMVKGLLLTPERNFRREKLSHGLAKELLVFSEIDVQSSLFRVRLARGLAVEL